MKKRGGCYLGKKGTTKKKKAVVAITREGPVQTRASEAKRERFSGEEARREETTLLSKRKAEKPHQRRAKN